ncbi:MAG: L,D-transpeptidase family protein [Flavipsychrobacter sp.]
MRKLFLSVLMILGSLASQAQDEVQTFRNFQLSFSRVSQAWVRCNDTLQRVFASKGVTYPPSEIYLRTFKAQNEMELWARDSTSDKFKLIKLYRICALSGILGPKRTEGDRQVPEGYYFIEDFNPKSDYFLSLLLNYPNYSDMVVGDKKKPGGDIYIHGGCVTVGCMPMTDPVIQEIYTLCLNAKFAGQNYIPVHIFPTRFNQAGLNFLGKEYGTDTTKQRFWVNLKQGYDYFEHYKKLEPVIYNPEGRYIHTN